VAENPIDLNVVRDDPRYRVKVGVESTEESAARIQEDGVPLSLEPKRTLSRHFTSGGSHLKPEVTVGHTTSRAPFGGCAGLGSLLDFSDHPAIPQIASDCVRRSVKISLTFRLLTRFASRL